MATYVHGKGSNFNMDNAAGTPVDFSSIISEANLDISLDTADTSHFGSNSKTYITGQNDATGSVTGLFDRTLLATITTLYAGFCAGTTVSATVQLGPEGTTTGSTKITQEMIMTSLKIGANVGSLVSVSFDLQRTGDTTFGNF